MIATLMLGAFVAGALVGTYAGARTAAAEMRAIARENRQLLATCQQLTRRLHRREACAR